MILRAAKIIRLFNSKKNIFIALAILTLSATGVFAASQYLKTPVSWTTPLSSLPAPTPSLSPSPFPTLETNSSEVLGVSFQSPQSSPTPKRSPSPSPSSSPDPALVAACNSVIVNVNYFKGFACYKEAYDDYTKDNKESEGSNVLKNIETIVLLLEGSNKTVPDLLLQQCTKIGIESYRTCSSSLSNNIDRFKQEILSRYASDFQTCSSKIAAGNQEEIDLNKDYFWKYKMKENIEGLFTYCYQHGNSFNNYHF